MSDFLFLIFTMVQIPENYRMSLFYEDKISELITVHFFKKEQLESPKNILEPLFIQNCPLMCFYDQTIIHRFVP